jgi:CPA2 family monovalent cation:H+ antiporter-2
MLLVAGLVVIAAVIILRRAFIRLYSKAQAALQETLSQTPPARHHEEHAPLPALMREAELNLTPIPEHSPAAGKLIGELRLRTLTGASIVGIERPNENIINPGPDEEIRPGDRILLLGTHTQLHTAQTLLTGQTSPEGLTQRH